MLVVVSPPVKSMGSPLDFCRDPEGWGPKSGFRKFDLTPCFEEGVVLPLPLLLLVVVGTHRIYCLSSSEKQERSRKSVWLLRAKVVCTSDSIVISFC